MQLDYHADYDFEGGSAAIASSSSVAPPTGSPVPRDFSATRSEISVDSMERTNVITSHGPMMGGEHSDAWLDDLQQRGATIVQVKIKKKNLNFGGKIFFASFLKLKKKN